MVGLPESETVILLPDLYLPRLSDWTEEGFFTGPQKSGKNVLTEYG
jgi:hypothetical protein